MRDQGGLQDEKRAVFLAFLCVLSETGTVRQAKQPNYMAKEALEVKQKGTTVKLEGDKGVVGIPKAGGKHKPVAHVIKPEFYL
eukprot:scaffold113763_cov17-Tisochrysis_lutea.AAC.1